MELHCQGGIVHLKSPAFYHLPLTPVYFFLLLTALVQQLMEEIDPELLKHLEDCDVGDLMFLHR